MRSSKDTSDVVGTQYQCRFEAVDDYQWHLHVSASDSKQNKIVLVKIFDDDLSRRDFPSAPAVAVDLIELAIFTYAVDRAIQPDRSSPCQVHVIAPVRSPDMLSQGNTMKQLTYILHWYTGYEWSFTFEQRTAAQRKTESPTLFDWRQAGISTDVALWSGGLDCLTGLLNRAIEHEDRQFILCGTGNNNKVHHLQERVVSFLPDSIRQRIKLSRVHFDIRALEGPLPRNPRLRSRGFTFILIGAMCAFLEGQSVLNVYENGIGAINLRFRESEVGLNHARSVHPLSLMLIGQWLSRLLNTSIDIRNPFLFWTKAQMCQILLDDQRLLSPAFQTQTCDRLDRHKKSEGVRQCGQCSSCILRRYAFAVLGMEDQSSYVRSDDSWLRDPVTFDSVKKGNHIPAALRQVDMFRQFLDDDNPWQRFAIQYETLSAHVVDRTAEYHKLTPDEMRRKLLQLFQQYTTEWQTLGHVLPKMTLTDPKSEKDG